MVLGRTTGRRRGRFASDLALGLLLVALATAVSPGAAEASTRPLMASAAPGPGANTFVPTGSMSASRAGQTATLLPDGKVLIAGGGSRSAELYDPATGRFAPTGSMSTGRSYATATLLPDGDVLVAGGCCHGPYSGLSTAELYHPSTGTWSATGTLHKARSGATATLLPDGQVLVAGGACNGTAYGCDAGSFLTNQRSAELYDPAAGTWTLTGSMAYGRESHTATLLGDGKVLVTGGFNNCDDDFCYDLNRAELYDPATGRWSPAASMHTAREQQSAALLADGDVLVAGGSNIPMGCCNPTQLASAELYDPATNSWNLTASMPQPHAGAISTLLQNGWALVAGGGSSSANVYEPGLHAWVPVGAMSTVRMAAAAAALPDGRVLVTGGDAADGAAQSTAEVYTAGRGPLAVVSPESVSFGGDHVGTRSGPLTYSVTNEGSAGLVVAGVEVTGTDASDFNASTNCTAGTLPRGWTCTVQVTFAPTATQLRTAQVAVVDNAPLSPQAVAVSGYGIGPDSWSPTGSLAAAADLATATLLPQGHVLVAGGASGSGASVASAQIYDSVTGTFTPTGSLNVARSDATAIRLSYGAVLVAGGYNPNLGPLSSAELYDPFDGSWIQTAPMLEAGDALSSVQLSNGKVLVTGFGGHNSELYDPAGRTWSFTGTMPSSDSFGAAVLLNDGRVLAFGGGTTAAELYDPATNTWSATASLRVAREHSTATLLPGGKVLVTGGAAPNGGGALSSAELYDPKAGGWAPTGSMTVARYGQTATLLPDGEVLVAGGCTQFCTRSYETQATAEVYVDGFFDRTNTMTTSRLFPIATLLPDGDVLVTGGDSSPNGRPTNTAELYNPVLARVSPRSGPVGQAVTVSGGGYYAHEVVNISWEGANPVSARTKTTATGTFTLQMTVPSGPPGTDLIICSGTKSFASAQTTFTVTSGP
jgi:N-acetylneuraminic acid mutarotase